MLIDPFDITKRERIARKKSAARATCMIQYKWPGGLPRSYGFDANGPAPAIASPATVTPAAAAQPITTDHPPAPPIVAPAPPPAAAAPAVPPARGGAGATIGGVGVWTV